MNTSNVVPVITLDGPSGTGKGTIACMLAKHLGWHFLDSGVIYRVLAHLAEQNGVVLQDIPKLVKLGGELELSFEFNATGELITLLAGDAVGAEIRSEACGQAASRIATIPDVRKALLQRQRAFAIAPGLVTDGRDMGTVVFPNAALKLYLFASPEERAKRRYLQLKEKRNDVSLAQVIEELEKRDARDSARTFAPLRPAEDAIHIDTTRLSIVQVFNNVLQLVDKHLNR